MTFHLRNNRDNMIDAIEVPIELGVPLPGKYRYQDLKRRVEAACATADFLAEHGAMYPEPSRQDKEEAARLVAEYAEDEKKASKQNTDSALARTSTQSIIYAKSLLDEYGHRVVDNSVQIRNLVTTKLLHESENVDPKVRLKALELLGKISDVGLFSEKTEVTVTHQTSDELKDKLREKLERLINPPEKPAAEDTKKLEAMVTGADPDLDFSDVVDGEYEEVVEEEGHADETPEKEEGA